ncbi:cold-regulated protein 27-like [Phoenix dactylifera]|uniref:Cold-regulated protein 27-like n=1 Tax=Phoenix dactylifera TaxID=42345 RepID=A0A8B7CS86_PHODC|nr:cold-regulated protein 27-like [Phoenix dactylifera]
MDDNRSNRPIKAEVSGIESPRKVVDSWPTGWTDEKHNLYLSSIEASFVSQLYSSKYNSKDLLGSLSRTQIRRNSSGSNASSLTSGQYKVLQGGCWENLKFERAKRCKDIENEPRSLSSNPWIRHFRSPSTGKGTRLTSNQVNDRVLATQEIEVATQSHGREAINTKQLLSCPHICLQDSVGSTTEVSDQNFVDDEFEQMKQSSRTYRKKRPRTAVADRLVNDQVVPSRKSYATPSSGENHVCLNEGNAECSSKTSEITSSFLPVEPEPPIKDQDLKCQLM